MKLKVGKKIKVVQEKRTGISETSSKIGVLERIYKNFFIVKFENHRESFTNADVIAPKDKTIYMRVNDRWDTVTREMLG